MMDVAESETFKHFTVLNKALFLFYSKRTLNIPHILLINIFESTYRRHTKKSIMFTAYNEI